MDVNEYINMLVSYRYTLQASCMRVCGCLLKLFDGVLYLQLNIIIYSYYDRSLFFLSFFLKVDRMLI